MNNNKNDRRNAALNINMPKKEINTGCAEICIEEFSYKGVTLKGLHAHAHAEFTDEKVRVETDACMKMFGQLLSEFAPSIAKLLEKEAEIVDVRRELYAAQTKAEEARAEKYKAQAEAAAHECKCNKEIKDADI